MKLCPIFLLVLLMPFYAKAQYPVAMRNLWTRPQVHIVFNGYTLSFAIRDIDKTLGLLRSIGDSTHDASCGLDTSKNYFYELYPGSHTEFLHDMQPLMQNVVGCFLLTGGHAIIKNSKHKILKEITVDIDPMETGDTVALISFYDPKTKAMIFQGKMSAGLYKKDLGIDD